MLAFLSSLPDLPMFLEACWDLRLPTLISIQLTQTDSQGLRGAAAERLSDGSSAIQLPSSLIIPHDGCA